MKSIILIILFILSLGYAQSLEIANKLFKKSNYDSTIIVLNSIKKGHSEYKKAQKLFKKTVAKQQEIVNQQFAAQRDSLQNVSATRKEAKAHFRYERDDFEKREIYESSKYAMGMLTTLIYSRVVIKDKEQFTMLVPVYQASNWLFVENVKILLNDGNVVSFDVDPARKVVGAQNLTETCYISIKRGTLEEIRDIGAKGIRFTGQDNYKDYDLTTLRYKNLNKEIQKLSTLLDILDSE